MAKLSVDSTQFYAVGWLEAWRSRGRRVQMLRRVWRYDVKQARAGNWRAVKNSFNGWMFEPVPWPEGARRCGSGWTQRRAVRSFWRYYQEENRAQGH